MKRDYQFIKKGGLIFLVLAAFFIFPKIVWASSGLIINEIMYDLKGSDEKHEWLELYNAGPAEIDLTGFKINDGDSTTNHGLNAPPKNNSRGSLVLAANSYLLLAHDAATLATDLPNYNGTVIDTVLSLGNDSATLKIINADGQEISSVSYSKTMGANGNGKTLAWDGKQFKESLAEGGTPGSANSVLDSPTASLPASLSPSASPTTSAAVSPTTTTSALTQPAYQYSKDIYINEFLPAPTSDNKEWVELFNTGDESVNLSGWSLGAGEGTTQRQLIGSDTILQSGDFLAVTFQKNILNNSGDQIKLLWPDGQIVQLVKYGSAQTGLAAARFNSGQWIWTNQPTPGAANKESFLETSAALKTQVGVSSITPNVETVSQTSAPAPPRPKNLSASPTDGSAAGTANTALPSITEIEAGRNLAAASQSQTGISSSSNYLWLLAVMALASLAALGLLYFKRRQNLPIDKNKPKF